MSKSIVLTGTGRDQVGIVARLTEALFDLGCNLLDSSMTLLRGEFAIIVMVKLPDAESIETLKSRLQSLEKTLALTIHVRELSDEELNPAAPAVNPHIISVYGADRPGIVAGITRVLADLGANITDVQTTSTISDGKDIFVMILEVAVPDNLVGERFSSQLIDEGKRLGVDIAIQQIDVMEL